MEAGGSEEGVVVVVVVTLVRRLEFGLVLALRGQPLGPLFSGRLNIGDEDLADGLSRRSIVVVAGPSAGL